MTRYTFHGDPNGNLVGVQGDQGFDVDTSPNNYFLCDGGTVWFATNISGGDSGAWGGVVSATPISSTVINQTIVNQPAVSAPPASSPFPNLPSSSQTNTVINCRIGLSGQLYDPNSTNPACIKWITLSPRQIRCLSQIDPSQFLKRNITPDKELRWDFLYEAKFIYVELSISGVGGQSFLSGIVANADAKPIKY